MHPEDFTLEAHARNASINAILGSPAGGYTFEYFIEGGIPKRFIIDPGHPDVSPALVTYQHDTKGFWRRIATRPDGTTYENAMQDSGVLAALLYSLAKGHKVTYEDILPEEPEDDEEVELPA